MSSGADEGAIKKRLLLATQAFTVLEGVLTVSSEQQAGAVRLHMVRRFFLGLNVGSWPPRPSVVRG